MKNEKECTCDDDVVFPSVFSLTNFKQGGDYSKLPIRLGDFVGVLAIFCRKCKFGRPCFLFENDRWTKIRTKELLRTKFQLYSLTE